MIGGFTGVDAPYEPPTAPDLVLDTKALDVERSVAGLTAYIRRALAETEARRADAKLAAE